MPVRGRSRSPKLGTNAQMAKSPVSAKRRKSPAKKPTKKAKAAAAPAAKAAARRPLFLNDVHDPTFIFAISTLFSVCFIEGHELEGGLGTLTMREASAIPSTVLGFFWDPAWAVGIIALLVARELAGDAVELSAAARRRCGWYLWNAIVFHIMMDGMAGGKWGNSLMQENYKLLDRRFKGPDSGVGEGDIANAALVVNIELFVHSVLCLAAYVGIARDAKWQHEAELLALTVQLFGLFVFVGPEFLTHCPNMVPHGELSCFPPFTPYTFFYFWFGVGVNVVWLVVPICMIVGAINRSVAAKK